MHCVYLTIYSGSSLPPKYEGALPPKRYIGSAKLSSVLTNNYKGSVTSKKYSKIWRDELRENLHLFKTRILSYHESGIAAREEEKRLQVKYSVVKSPMYVNMAIASPNGFFGKPNVGIEFSKETREKMRVARKGRTYEDIFGEEKAKELRESRKAQRAWNKGKETDPKTVAKLKESIKGMFFITNGIEDRKVKHESDIPEGWRRGRTNGVKHCPSGWNKGLPAWNKGMKR
jgi:hypothetical protein